VESLSVARLGKLYVYEATTQANYDRIGSTMGFLTNALNPKIAVFYLSIFTQFLHPERGLVFMQSFILGCIHITLSFVVNLAMVFAASHITVWLSERPLWVQVRKYLMGTVLAGLGLKLAFSERR